MVCRTRIIPARAGQTVTAQAAWTSGTDHPRACGANSEVCMAVYNAIGSSPRVRGKRAGVLPLGLPVRIIPARAGQTDLPDGRAIESTDHPRACGANSPILCENS